MYDLHCDAARLFICYSPSKTSRAVTEIANHTAFIYRVEGQRHTGQFFLGGLSHLCPKNFSTVPEKTDMLTCKITLPDSPHPVIISKNPGFRTLYLARQNEFCFFLLINTKKCFFSLLAAGFCPKNLADPEK